MTATEADQYDVMIIGGGPAGLAAALYAARDRFKTLILERRGMCGGQIMLTERIENYPGYESVSGPELIGHMVKQCENFGAEIRTGAEVERIERLPDGRLKAVTADGDELAARVVIVAPGSDYRPLGVPGEKELIGSGVSYCGTCDAPFFKDKHVVSIGGGNTAVEETIHLAKFCSKVTMVHRRDEFRAQKVLVEELNQAARQRGNIELRLSSVVERIVGDGKVQAVQLKSLKTGQAEQYACEGVFVFVGMTPNTGWLKGALAIDENGFIKADCRFMRSSLPGVFVVGDCRASAAMQLATACGDGVVAAMMLKRYLADPAWWTHDQAGPAAEKTEPAGW